MKLKSFKEKNDKKVSIIVFTIICILLVSGVALYRTFAIFEVKTNQNVINGKIQGMGDIEFAFYVDGKIEKNVPEKNMGYTLNTETSKCIDMTTGNQSSNISWNHEKWSVEIKNLSTTKTKCYLYFDKLYVETELNGAIPDLGNELVAITFDETNGKARKASLTSEWYNYAKQQWANAVILRTKEDYQVGEEIPEENIESYFVWIPRYEYQLWNGVTETDRFAKITSELGSIENANEQSEVKKARKINIVFKTKDSEIQKGNNIGEYLTHPAFTSFNSNGFWVGKFETGYNQDPEGESVVTPDATWTVGGAEKDLIASNQIIIKPNVYSWRGIGIANAFKTSYEYKRILDSHMMKNTEWGAVAYLTNSKYGRCAGEICDDVRINNSSNFITGNSAVNEPTCGYTASNETCNKYDWNSLGQDTDNINNYRNAASVISSTTNNYTGVFDMSGGSWENVMGVMLDKDGNLTSGSNNVYNSNFVGTLTCPIAGTEPFKTTWTEADGGLQWPSSKYYDTYEYAETDQNFNRGLFGDATKELGTFYSVKYRNTVNSTDVLRVVSEWNADDAFFVYHAVPWFKRGGFCADGTDAGNLAFSYFYGSASGEGSFRVILTP